MESLESKKNFNIKKSLEDIPTISSVTKIELDDEYFKWAEENLSKELLELIKANYESLEIHKFSYLSDGLSVVGFVWSPRNIKDKLPVVIWNRGGTGEFASLNSGKRGGLYSNTPCDISQENTIVIASDYRGGVGSEGKDERGGADLNDVVAIKKIADQLPMTKPGKNIVAGESRGCMMNYQLASKEDWVKGVISLSGETDLFLTLETRPDLVDLFKDSFGGSEEEMKKRSVTYFYKSIPKNIPMLIMHATNDNRMPIEGARKLESLLKEDGYDKVEYYEFEGGGHGFHTPSSPYRDESLKIIKDFIRRNIS